MNLNKPYTVKADIGGKIAQLGSRLIDGTAKKLAGEFFAKLGGIVDGSTAAAATAPEVVKKGWFGKAIGTTATAAVAGLILIPSCCLTGHRPGERAAFPICHADGGFVRPAGL